MKKKTRNDSGYTFVEVIISLSLILFIISGIYLLNHNIFDFQKKNYSNSIYTRDILRLTGYLDQALLEINHEYWEPFPELKIGQDSLSIGNESSGIVELKMTPDGAALIRDDTEILFSGIDVIKINKGESDSCFTLDVDLYGEKVSIPFSLYYRFPAEFEAL